MCARQSRRKERGYGSAWRHRAQAPVMHLEESGIPAAGLP
ncbi:hypothetical protein STVIR_2904 [Streptomyces viridochromogenes Tue57]|uniref:Uncharacterized protein n=1 Tax=Streptomyces viridochromogenes Tue57 TaxID=1160705 RepID=L8PF38_STRVR|nr:hypothetical protein STVIR_2904 [Streptomyces viridochromogenes Tue57]